MKDKAPRKNPSNRSKPDGQKPFRDSENRPQGPRKPFQDREDRGERPSRPQQTVEGRFPEGRTDSRTQRPSKPFQDRKERGEAPLRPQREPIKRAGTETPLSTSRKPETRRQTPDTGRRTPDTEQPTPGTRRKTPDTERLNKYLSNAGVASRREADKLIEEGKVRVNGEVITELGYKIKRGDKVTMGRTEITPKNNVYILLNKPKGYLSTTKDPEGRKTVLDLIEGATQERVYPVGRLDRASSGLLILTNDGELTNRLTHPSHNFTKIYAVTLDKDLTKNDFIHIMENRLILEDGPVVFDEMAWTDETDRSKLGIKIHSGRNRIIRRTFEAMGYEVKKLDRVMFGMLTKRDLPSGKWRFLGDKEVRILKGQMKGKA